MAADGRATGPRRHGDGHLAAAWHQHQVHGVELLGRVAPREPDTVDGRVPRGRERDPCQLVGPVLEHVGGPGLGVEQGARGHARRDRVADGHGRRPADVEQQDAALPLVPLCVGRLSLGRDQQSLAGGVDGQEGGIAPGVERLVEEPASTVRVGRVHAQQRDPALSRQGHPGTPAVRVDDDLAGGSVDLDRADDPHRVGASVEEHHVRQVGEGDSFKMGDLEVRVFDTPGHTLGHISYWLPEINVAFVGDTMFAMGCGRVIEGTMEMMWSSLAKLIKLPPSTVIYTGHEYTAANAKFALTIEPENEALQTRAREVDALRAAGKPTLPTRLDIELATNPFLRVASPAIVSRLGMTGAKDWQIFGEVRERKNRS